MAKTLELFQLNDGYCYNSDSLFLYAFAREFIKDGAKLLDIGAGCGILGLLCARDFRVNLTLNDKSSAMIRLCRANARANDIKCEIVEGDILGEIPQMRGFDVIITNPPFYRKDARDSTNAHLRLARKSENLPFDSLVKFAKNALNPKGAFVFCYDAKEIKSVFSALDRHNLNLEALRFVHPRTDKSANLLLAKCRTSKSIPKILPPLYNYAGENYSAETAEIFRMCKTASKKIASLEHL